MSMATTRPSAIVKPKATRGSLPGAQTRPIAPLMSAGRAAWARPEKVRATAAVQPARPSSAVQAGSPKCDGRTYFSAAACPIS